MKYIWPPMNYTAWPARVQESNYLTANLLLPDMYQLIGLSTSTRAASLPFSPRFQMY
jgi:hypothetical protein